MIGAIIGDIIGSRFEHDNIKSKEFELFTDDCTYTDDSVMTIAIAQALLKADGNWQILGEYAVEEMRSMGRKYPFAGYGSGFRKWIFCATPNPYNSFGNGAAMRVSACGYTAHSLEDAILLSRCVTEVTHNHPEGIKGAEATTVAIWLARQGMTIKDIKEYMIDNYYPIDFVLDEIRDRYEFDVTCQGSVPQALEAFFESESFDDAIRNAISIGGDSDTISAITGGIAEAYYGIPEEIASDALKFLDDYLIDVVRNFDTKHRKT